MPHAVRTTRVEPAPTAVVRRRAPPHQVAKVIPEACGTVWSVVKSLGVRGAGRHVAVYLTGSLDQVDMEIGVELAAPFGGHGEVVDSATPGGEVATVAHFGPYAALGDAHRAIRDWCAANHRIPAGPNWEVYGHWMPEWNTDPSKIRTDVFYLLQ